MKTCLNTIERFGFLFFPFLIQFDPATRLFRKCFWRCLVNLSISITTFFTFIYFTSGDEYIRDIDMWYWFDLFRQALWALTSLAFSIISLLDLSKTVEAFNHIMLLPNGMNLKTLKRFLDYCIWICLIYYGPFLSYVYVAFNLRFAITDQANFFTLFAYNLTTLNVIFWCLLQTVVLHYLRMHLTVIRTKLDDQMLHELLNEHDKALETSQMYVKSIKGIIPWLLLFSSIVFIGALFFTHLFVDYNGWRSLLCIYVGLSDLPMIWIYGVFVRINGLWTTVSGMLILIH